MKHVINSRYYLRTVKVEDAKDIFVFASNPNVTKYLTWKPHKEIADTIWAINNLYLVKEKDNLPNNYAIIDSNNNRVIGIIDFIKSEEKVNIGYFLDEKYWGLGIMTLALDKLLDIAFNHLLLNELYIYHEIDNIGSMNVILKNGFKHNIELTVSNSNLKGYKITKDDYKNDK